MKYSFWMPEYFHFSREWYGTSRRDWSFEVYSFKAKYEPQMTGVKAFAVFKDTFGNILHQSSSYFENQSVLFSWCSIGAVLNVIVLFRLGFRNSLKARASLEKLAMDFTKTPKSAIFRVKKYKRTKISCANTTTFWLVGLSFEHDLSDCRVSALHYFLIHINNINYLWEIHKTVVEKIFS